MILASLFGIAQYVYNDMTFWNGGFWGRGRVYSTFVNPNYWGAAMNLVIFYPILNILEKRNVKVNIGIFVIFFFNLFFSSTRGSWLGFVMGLGLIGVLKNRKLIYYGLGILGGMVLLPITRNRFLEVMDISARINVWKTGFYMFMDHFWLGVGNGNYLYEYKRYVKELHPELYMHKTIYSVHNSYLKMFAELGVFGGMTFTMMYLNLFGLVCYVYKFSLKYKRCALAFLCFGVTYLFQNLMNDLIFIPQLNVFVWVIAALLVKGVLVEKELPERIKK
jgi:putative inorganic carbon (hco3(-)) transporter